MGVPPSGDVPGELVGGLAQDLDRRARRVYDEGEVPTLARSGIGLSLPGCDNSGDDNRWSIEAHVTGGRRG
jgi:hypothetical protein